MFHLTFDSNHCWHCQLTIVQIFFKIAMIFLATALCILVCRESSNFRWL